MARIVLSVFTWITSSNPPSNPPSGIIIGLVFLMRKAWPREVKLLD